MRKYRGKRVDNGEWVYGYLIGTDVIVGEIVEFTDEYFNCEWWCRVDPKTIGQSTGLKDEDGQEIYKDDIVEYEDYNGGAYLFRKQPLARDVVSWNPETGGYKVRGMGMTFKANKYKIIGNIHDNPELAEGTV